MHTQTKSLFCFILFSSMVLFFQRASCWNWSAVNLSDPDFLQKLTFPKKFIFGVADSAYQTEGAEGPHGKLYDNSWTRFEKERNLIPAQKGCQRWTRFKEDIELIKKSGFKIYRFSVEWSKIEPQPGMFNQEAIDHYKDVCKELIKQKIIPVVCLFHHTWPCWFGDLDAFEKNQNNSYFIRYGTFVLRELAPYVTTWMTFNEPEGYAMQAYYRGHYPPAKKDMRLAGKALKHMMQCHVELYQNAKKQNKKNSVGFAKIMQPVEPYSWYNPLEVLASSVANYLMDDCLLNFFTTGIFNWSTVGINKVYYEDLRAKKSLDFLGVNYYTHTRLKNFSPKSKIHEVMSEDGKAVHPEGIYNALKKCSKLNVPLYVAENGVSDSKDILKEDYIKRHLCVISKACKDGIDVRGYFYWTLMDNFEWLQAYNQCYGLYRVDRITQKRTLRDGAKKFIAYIQTK